MAEKAFLDNISVQLMHSINNKKQHQRLLKDYSAQLTAINQLSPLLK